MLLFSYPITKLKAAKIFFHPSSGQRSETATFFSTSPSPEEAIGAKACGEEAVPFLCEGKEEWLQKGFPKKMLALLADGQTGPKKNATGPLLQCQDLTTILALANTPWIR